MRSPDGDALAALRAAFGSLGVRWYVFGAHAAIHYGVARLTEDIDVTVELGDRTSAELVEALATEQLRLRIPDHDIEAFVSSTRVLPVHHQPSGIPIDVVLAGPGLETLFLDRALMTRIDALDVPLATPEDLVIMKVIAGRPKDLEDARVLLETDLEHEHIRSTLELMDRALDRNDLVRALDALLAEPRASEQLAARGSDTRPS